LAHGDPQLQKLPVNPRRTPERIGRRQLTEQSANILRYPRTSDAMSAFPRPEQTKAAAMPRDDRLRFDDVNGRPPVAPGVREPCPEKTVRRRKAKTWAAGSVHDSELVPKRDDFQVHAAPLLGGPSGDIDERVHSG
jgi:hypothetical protein